MMHNNTNIKCHISGLNTGTILKSLFGLSHRKLTILQYKAKVIHAGHLHIHKSKTRILGIMLDTTIACGSGLFNAGDLNFCVVPLVNRADLLCE